MKKKTKKKNKKKTEIFFYKYKGFSIQTEISVSNWDSGQIRTDLL